MAFSRHFRLFFGHRLGKTPMCQWPLWISQIWRSRLTFGLAASIIFAVASSTLQAQPEPTVRHVVVTLNKSRVVSFAAPFKTASVASTEIADVTPLTDHSLYIQGKGLGTTSISVFNQNMQLVELLDVEVAIDTQTLQGKIRGETRSDSIRVLSDNGAIVLTGVAPNAPIADRAVTIAQSAGGTVINQMTVAPTQQVMLKVRFLEADRTAERDLAINWFGTNGSKTRGFSTGLGIPLALPGDNTGIGVISSAGALVGSTGIPFATVLANLVSNNSVKLDVMISALENKNLVRALAEPDLVTVSGEKATFLAGGEFPVPQVASTTTGQGVTPTFQFEQFGVGLDFVPTVLEHGVISLRLAPSVSELNFADAVTISGTTIPGLTVRKASTTIQLRDGQSFMIAGLYQSRNARNLDQTPWLGSVPVLGALFRSAAFQNAETDLVIIVTVHLVQPATPMDQLATPLDKNLPSNDVDFFANGQEEVPKRYSDYVTSGGNVNGPYGYILPIEQGSSQPVYKGGAAQ
jgi:pilus assembly protein CpaC